jgi:hypothetical protein
MGNNPMIKNYAQKARDVAVEGLTQTKDMPDLPDAETVPSPASGSLDASEYKYAADTRDAALVHTAFRGDRSLFAGQGKGIDATPEYKRK